MDDYGLPPAIPQYKDRSAWLVAFGIFNILMGVICSLAIVLVLFATQAAKSTPEAEMPPTGMLPLVLTYGLMTVALVWLGIGSILARRWARAILLISSWMWLLMGVFMVLFFGFAAPGWIHSGPLGHEGGAGAVGLIVGLAFAGLFLGFFFLVLPIIWVLFYGGKSVKATCEARNPLPCWTDACPLPVLAVSLILGCWAPFLAAMPFISQRAVLPFFGTFVVGPGAAAIYGLLAVIWAYCAWGTYKLDRRAWWVVIASLAVFTISNVLTYSTHDIVELYRLMGYPEKQIAQIQQFDMFGGRRMMWMTLLCSLPYFAYLLYVRRFFPRHTAV